MKNIHILPTDKPSRLLWCFEDKRYYTSIDEFYFKNQNELQNQNIYITSDEEIKEGDWYIHLGKINKRYRKNPNAEYPYHSYKKIILTTDQDLIKDGVQAIDDEFLEWFVKNPSCEKVEVEEEDYSQKCRECGETVKRGYNCTKGCFMKSGNFIPTDKNINYKIIIPQEEPNKTHYLDELPNMDKKVLAKMWESIISKEETKQRYEKYSERFDNDESAIGNPKTWGKRVLTEEDIFNQRDIDAVTDYISKEQQKQALIDMMKSDEELVLYGEVYGKQGIALTSDYIQNIEKEIKLEEIFNDEKKENLKKFIDEIKNPSEPNQALKDAAQRYEKYSERFDNDKSAIGNPQTWGKRLICKDCNESLEDCTCIQDTVEFPKQGTTIEEVAEKLKGRELFKESNDRARKTLSEIKSLPIQETLEDKLKELVLEWQKRQEKYYDIAYENVDNVHTNRKFTYKAMATRDCWKELLKLIENEK